MERPEKKSELVYLRPHQADGTTGRISQLRVVGYASRLLENEASHSDALQLFLVAGSVFAATGINDAGYPIVGQAPS